MSDQASANTGGGNPDEEESKRPDGKTTRASKGSWGKNENERKEKDDEVWGRLTQSQRKNSTERAFFQQKLPGWEPVMTADWGAGVFMVFGVISLAVGIPLLVASNGLREEIIHYGDECEIEGTGELCQDFLMDPKNLGSVCNCSVNFKLDKALEGEIFMYYGMQNFYQNHRQYAKSRDWVQLRGEFRDLRQRKSIDNYHEDCEPLRYAPNATQEFTPYAPCGLIANSLFNDSISLQYENNGGFESVDLKKKGIAWSTDYNTLFINPPGDTLQEAFNNTERPPYWSKEPWELDPADEDNNGYKNEDFIVWMKAAVFPKFRKLYRKITHSGTFETGLPVGTYKLNVQYAFPVDKHKGDKIIVLTNLSWAGGKNPFLGILSIVLSAVCFLLGVLFILLHVYTKDWDRELMASMHSQLDGKRGVDNPAMHHHNKVSDEGMTPETWRRRLSSKSPSPAAATEGGERVGLQKGPLMRHTPGQAGMAGHPDQGIEILGMAGATQGVAFSNGHVSEENMNVWM